MSTLPVYELTFEVSPLDEAREEALIDSLDAFVAVRHGESFVTMDVDAPNGVVAGTSALRRLRQLGANPRRLVHDLVTRSEIARRVGVSPQAVGMWLRGDRHGQIPTPTPWISSGVELWIWGEVVIWLGQIGQDVDEANDFPSRWDNQFVNGLIASASGWTHLPTHSDVSVETGASTPMGAIIRSVDINVRSEFQLAS